MKHIKPYKIFESQEHPNFPTTEKEVHDICKKYEIENYTINDDLSIDTDKNIKLRHFSLIYLPLKFNKVNGDFDCSHNKLISLKNAPNIVTGAFYCYNNELTSLKGSPDKVGEHFHCHGNNLTSLKGAPSEISGDFGCHYNNIKSLNHLPSGIYFNSYTSFINNPIYSVINTFIHNNEFVSELIEEFNDYSIVRGDTVVLDRLKVFCSDFNLILPYLGDIKKHYTIV